MSAPLCRRCGKTEALHLSGRSDTRWCAGMIGAEYDPPPPTPKAKPMKTDLEIMRELVAAQSSFYSTMAATVSGRLPEAANAATEIAAVLGVLMGNIDTLMSAPSAGDDHGAALAYAQTALTEARDELAVSDAERHRLRGELEKVKYGSHQHQAALDLVTAECNTLKAALDEAEVELASSTEAVALRDDLVEMLRRDHTAALASVEGERDGLVTALDATTAERDVSRDRLSGASTRCTVLDGKLTKARHQRDDAKCKAHNFAVVLALVAAARAPEASVDDLVRLAKEALA